MKKDDTNKNVRCTYCEYSQYVPTTNRDGPAIIYCASFEKRFVANSPRKCLSLAPIKPFNQ